jgi:hypothetical protein
MFAVVLPITLALIGSGLVVSRILPSCPGCSRAVAFGVSALGMAAVAAVTVSVAVAAFQTQNLVPGDPFAAQVWLSGVLVGIVLGGLLAAAATAVALLARR